ncbi:tyrosine-type recombinase/integrase [Sporomusa ovata]|uniref:tyrosine-type recombinase/integrase n=1 Tax=Sporomusa ovata TaxID=2378 RepID=UPI0009DB9398
MHDLRHDHASRLFAQGEHPRDVQDRLGHSSITLTMDTYTHAMPGRQKTLPVAWRKTYLPAWYRPPPIPVLKPRKLAYITYYNNRKPKIKRPVNITYFIGDVRESSLFHCCTVVVKIKKLSRTKSRKP